MSDTPRTDEAVIEGNRKSALLANYYRMIEFCKELEQEIAALKKDKEKQT